MKFDADARWLQFQHAGVLALFNFADEPRRVPLPAGAWDLALSSEPGDGCGTLASSRQWNPDLYAACGGRGGLIFVYAAGALSAAGVL